MLAGVVLGRFPGVMRRVKPVPVSDMRVVRRFLVIPACVVLGSFPMMSRRLFVVFCRHQSSLPGTRDILMKGPSQGREGLDASACKNRR